MLISLVLTSAKGNMEENMTATTTKEVLEKLFRDYDKYASPPAKHLGPHQVEISINIQSIFDISEKSSSFTIRYYIQLGWYDSRLEFSPFVENNQTIDVIWLPTNFITEKGTKRNGNFSDIANFIRSCL